VTERDGQPEGKDSVSRAVVFRVNASHMVTEKGHKRPSGKRGLYTPRAKQTRVIAASLAGKSKSQISREEGLKRDTVARILSQPEVEQLRESYRQQLLELVPNSVGLLADKLLTKTGERRKNADWRMAIEILKGAQIFVTKSEQQLSRKDEFEGRSDEDLKFCAEHGYFPEEMDSSGEIEEGTVEKRADKPLPN
jgi:hypothetical protein